MATSSATPASFPFDDVVTTNAVLRSPNGLVFYVHKHILSLASSFFEGMFSIDQPPSTEAQQPVIDVSERSEVIEGVLRLCYPVDEPDMSTVTKVVDILGAAHKYEMKSVKRRLQIPLRQLIDTYPLQVYAHACSYRLEDTAKDAASAWRQRAGSAGVTVVNSNTEWSLTPPGEAYIQEMVEIPSGMFFRLLKYIRTATFPAAFCDYTPEDGGQCVSLSTLQHQLDTRISLCRQLGSDPDITVHAIDGEVFPAHRLVLSVASRTLRDLIAKEGSDGAIYLTENSQTLAVVLGACYPGTDMSAVEMSVSLAASILGAARKYVLLELEVIAKSKLKDHICTQPLEVFFHAAPLGWKEGARACAVQLSRLPIIDLYAPLMETIPARYYYALLKFHYDYRRALIAAFRDGSYDGNHVEEAFGEALRQEWLWKETAEIAPEIFLASTIEFSRAMNGSRNYGYGSNYHSPLIILSRFETVKTSLRKALSMVRGFGSCGISRPINIYRCLG